MPACCLRQECRHKSLDLRAGHKCSRCLQRVHAIGCSVVDESKDLHKNLLCLNCHRLILQVTRKTASSGTNARQQREGKQVRKNNNTTQAIQRKSPPNTRTEKTNNQKSHNNAKAPKLKKTATQKSFVLEEEQSTPNPLLLKTVCFNVNDNKYGTKIAQHFFPDDASRLMPSLKVVNGEPHLL